MTLVPALELVNISKHFAGNVALHNASLSVAAGSIHGIVGENGAGKSTLMQIAYGLEQPDSGCIKFDGAVIAVDDPKAAIAHGLGMLHQKVSWLEQLSVLENIVLGQPIDSYVYQTNRVAEQELQHLSREFGFKFSLNQIMADLSYSQRQQVDILRALYRGVRVLILDEPMALLSAAESQHLFKLFVLLKTQGISVVVVSHKLVALHHICDVISVIKQGEVIKSSEPKDVSVAQITKLVVGHEVTIPQIIDKSVCVTGQPVLTVTKLNRYRSPLSKAAVPSLLLKDIDLTINSGQIVALVGLPGAGQSELLDVIAGRSGFDWGQITFAGRKFDASTAYNISQARELGIGYVPNSVLGLGLISEFSLVESLMLGCCSKKWFWSGLSRSSNLNHCAQLMTQWDIRPHNPKMKSGYFSAGNQQKMVLAREINQQPQLLLLNQPTHGVDVAGIALIYRQLFDLRQRGTAILLVADDLDEVISLADLAVIFQQGRIVALLDKSQLAKQKLRLLMTLGANNE